MRTQTLEYREGDKLLRGFLAWDNSRSKPQPGILVFHENSGLTDHERERATRLAELGYVSLACDMFGERPIAASEAERRAAFEEFRTKRLLPRALAGFDALSARPQVDRKRLAAIGFCLGGMVALELARSGADLKGVVSFHGGLATTHHAAAGQVKAKVLVCHGALDPFTTLEHVPLLRTKCTPPQWIFRWSSMAGQCTALPIRQRIASADRASHIMRRRMSDRGPRCASSLRSYSVRNPKRVAPLRCGEADTLQ